jgi:MoaA/NifB/PqqE/SkfB family radical SAM enzyme
VAHWDNAKIDEAKIIEELIPIKNKLRTLWLSGGEPGLLSVEFWDYLFYITPSSLKICTNGTFIIRGYAERFKIMINQIMIHCVEELDQEIHPIVLNFIRTSNISKIVNVVLHRHNVHLLSSFLNKYKDIRIDLNFADQTFANINKQYNKPYDYSLDKKSIISIISQLSKFDNYGQYTSFLTKKIIQNDYVHLNPWSNKNHD